MRILIVDPTSKIPVIQYGGTERILWDLGKTLHRLGHQVSYLVKKGSFCDFADIIIYNPEVHLEKQISKAFDVIHFHNNTIPINLPSITTLHGNTSLEDDIPMNTIFVSQSHANNHGASSFVHNGLDWDSYGKVNLKLNRNYFHFLGKANWKVKNLNGAVTTALKARQKLCVLGGEKWTFKNLKSIPFKKLHPRITYCGMVNNQEKVSVMEGSKGLLFPILWDEPFGLAIIESLYAGAPIFGTPYGSLPELIIPEVGILSTSTTTLAASMLENNFSPKNCHDYVVAEFSAQKMTEKYLELYHKVLTNQPINPEKPQRKKILQNFDFQ